jgi:hypothetical protein
VIPTRDDFARWREDHVTRFILAAHRQIAEDNKAEWVRISWENGSANAVMLQELRTRADAYEAISATTYEGYCDALGEAPRED